MRFARDRDQSRRQENARARCRRHSATNGTLVGMVTDRDITIRCVADHESISNVKAKDVMTSSVVYCRDNEDLEDAVHHEGKADPQAAGARRGDADGR